MTGPQRTNISCVMKSFRFSPDLVEDMERIIYLTTVEGGKPKYPSMTNLITTAVTEVIKKERRELEDAGVVWEHLGHGFKNSLKEEKQNG